MVFLAQSKSQPSDISVALSDVRAATMAAFKHHHAGGAADAVEEMALAALILVKRVGVQSLSHQARLELLETEAKLRVLQANINLRLGRSESAQGMFESTLEFTQKIPGQSALVTCYCCHIGAYASSSEQEGKLTSDKHLRAAYHIGRKLPDLPVGFEKVAISTAQSSFRKGQLKSAKEQFEFGLSLVKEANAEPPNWLTAYLSSYGVVCLLLGDFKTAGQTFERAAKATPALEAVKPRQLESETEFDQLINLRRFTSQCLVYGAAAYAAQGELEWADMLISAAGRRRGDVNIEIASLKPTLERAVQRAVFRGEEKAAKNIRLLLQLWHGA